MGEVNTENRGKNSGGGPAGLIPGVKKLSTRVDMTPVVDLAFLLLTFFMLATTFIKPQIMEVIMPDKKDDTTQDNQPKVNEKKVLSIVMEGDNKIYWYIGQTDAKVNETAYGEKGIRKVLLEQNKLIDKLTILIKPDDNSTYENFVDIMDEMKVTGISRYALDVLSDADKALMQPYGAMPTAAGAAPAAN
jgi:biopolymer transport protein ExbD